MKSNPKLTALQVELAQVQHEIETLIDTLTGANPILLSYVNSKIEELDGRKQELVKRIAELSVDTISPEQVKEISGYLDTWEEEVDFDDKRRVVDLMIRDNPKFCVTAKSGANRVKFIMGGRRIKRLPPCLQHNANGTGCQGGAIISPQPSI